MANEEGMYLIWSTEHRAWWRGGKAGYAHRLADAGIYSRDEAIKICRQAIPGTASRMGMLPEIPVRMADYEAMIKDLKVLPEHLKR